MYLTCAEQATLCTRLENTLEAYLYNLTHIVPIKHGAFKASITRFTAPSTSLSILHHSPLLIPAERHAVAQVKACYTLFRDGDQIPHRHAKKPKQLVERLISVLEDTARREEGHKTAVKKNVLVTRGGGNDKRDITRTIVYTRRATKPMPVKQASLPIFDLENAKKPTAKTTNKAAAPAETKPQAPSSNLFTYATTSDGETVGTRKSKQATKNAKEKERRKRKKAKLKHHDEDKV